MARVRVQYILRPEPHQKPGSTPRVPAELHERVLGGLRHRFDAREVGPSETQWIEVTSMNPRGVPFDRVNAEAHERLEAILDEIEPEWRSYYIILPSER